jgi:hypothetical protein
MAYRLYNVNNLLTIGPLFDYHAITIMLQYQHVANYTVTLLGIRSKDKILRVMRSKVAVVMFPSLII